MIGCNKTATITTIPSLKIVITKMTSTETTTVGQDLSNAAAKVEASVSQKASEAKESKVAQSVSKAVHDSAKSTVNAYDNAKGAVHKAYTDISETDTGKTISAKASDAGEAISVKAKEIATATQTKIDELRKE
jgi:hypothetical protein